MATLDGFKVVSLAANLPGPAAARRLLQLGARVLKVEPPAGDPTHHFSPEWYQELNRGQVLLTLDLKACGDRARLLRKLESAEMLLTASLTEALAKDFDLPIVAVK